MGTRLMPTLDPVDPMPSRTAQGDTNGIEDVGTPMPSVAVIVLNWNGRDDTIACIESLDEVEYPRFDVMVVDNGSSDGSVAAIRQRFPHLEIVETGRNLGFAEGNNVGIRLALDRGVDYVFLLNNDTVVHPSVLEELVAAAERCPDGGIFSAKILYYAEPTRIWYAGAVWDDRRMTFRHLADETQGRADERGVVATDYACGCAFLAKSAMLRERLACSTPSFFSPLRKLTSVTGPEARALRATTCRPQCFGIRSQYPLAAPNHLWSNILLLATACCGASGICGSGNSFTSIK